MRLKLDILTVVTLFFVVSCGSPNRPQINQTPTKLDGPKRVLDSDLNAVKPNPVSSAQVKNAAGLNASYKVGKQSMVVFQLEKSNAMFWLETSVGLRNSPGPLSSENGMLNVPVTPADTSMTFVFVVRDLTTCKEKHDEGACKMTKSLDGDETSTVNLTAFSDPSELSESDKIDKYISCMKEIQVANNSAPKETNPVSAGISGLGTVIGSTGGTEAKVIGGIFSAIGGFVDASGGRKDVIDSSICNHYK